MIIEISNEASQKVAAILGTSDEGAIGRLLERVANDEQLVRSLMLDELGGIELLAIREGIEDVTEGRIRPIEEFDAEFRARNRFSSRSSD